MKSSSQKELQKFLPELETRLAPKGQILRNAPKGQVIVNAPKGQIIVEYVLLLAIAVTIAGLLISGLVSRNPDSPGAIIAAWHAMLNTVAADDAGGVAPFP